MSDLEVIVTKVENGYTLHVFAGGSTIHASFADMVDKLKRVFGEVNKNE